MSLQRYLEEIKIDEIEDDQEFMEAEYNAIQTYCEDCGYSITGDDLDTIRARGLEEAYMEWEQTYTENGGKYHD